MNALQENAYGCLDFRREKLADPKRLSTPAQTHLSGCTLCQAFARRADALDKRAEEAMQVNVPDGLAERVILRARHGRRTQGLRIMALAASIILSVAIGVQWAPQFLVPREAGPAENAIRHVLHEPDAFDASHIDIPPERFAAVLASFGGELEASLGRVRYIKLCPLEDGGTGWHLVFETEQGLATLLLVPRGQDAPLKADSASRDGLFALVRPAGIGYYAVITDSPGSMKTLDEALRSKVRWKT